VSGAGATRQASRSCDIRVGINARYLYDDNVRGFNRYTICLVEALQRIDGLDLVLFTDSRWPMHPRFRARLDGRTQIVSLDAPRALIWEQAVLPAALRRLGIDVFHAPADGGVPVWKTCKQILTYHHALDRSIAYFVSRGELPGSEDDYAVPPRGIRGWRRRARHDAFRRLYLRRADTVITVSEFAKWELVSLLGIPADKVHVIHLAAADAFGLHAAPGVVDVARRKYGLPSRYLLYVGGLEPRKNVAGLIRVVAAARKAGLEEALVLAGGGREREQLTAAGTALGLVDGRDLIVLDHIHDDLPALYHGATAYVTLSWAESFSLPIVEAMACGTPVVASQMGAVPEVLGGAGVIVDPRDEPAAVRAVLSIAGDESMRTELKVRGLARARAFSWDATARRTAEVYRGLVDRAGAALDKAS
jgi:glycosyltransferase involved in cell wall biosynthesis